MGVPRRASSEASRSSVRKARCWMPGPLYSSRYSLICDFFSLASLMGMQKRPQGERSA